MVLNRLSKNAPRFRFVEESRPASWEARPRGSPLHPDAH